MPCSSARSMMAKLSGSVVLGPKFIVPRQSRLTLRPVRPRFVYSMLATLPPRAHSKANRESAAFARGRSRAEEDVVPARQALAGRLVAAAGSVGAGRSTGTAGGGGGGRRPRPGPPRSGPVAGRGAAPPPPRPPPPGGAA